jgi:hypothetical protein
MKPTALAGAIALATFASGLAACRNNDWHATSTGTPLAQNTRAALGTPSESASAPSFAIGGAENDDVANAIRAIVRTRADARPAVAAVRANLAAQQSHEVTLTLSQGRCVEMVGAGGAGVREVDLDVFDSTGSRVASETQHSATESVRFCAPSNGTYRFTVRSVDGAGVVGAQLFDVH